VVRRGCVNPGRTSWSPAGFWPWDTHAGSMEGNAGQSRQHRAHHRASAMVLPPMGRAEVPPVPPEHTRLLQESQHSQEAELLEMRSWKPSPNVPDVSDLS